MIKKLTSRKFIVTLLSAIAGVIAVIIGENEILTTVVSMLMVVVPSVVYCITEGKIDAESVKLSKNAVDSGAEKLLSENASKAVKNVTGLFEVLAEDDTSEKDGKAL